MFSTWSAILAAGVLHQAAPSAPQSVVPVEARRVILGSGRVLLPEGTYLRRSPGRLLPRGEGVEGRGLRFLPDDFGDDAQAAIALAPSPALEAAEALFVAGPVPGDAVGQTVRVEVSGEILAYRGRNWILADLIVPHHAPVSLPVPGADVDIPVDPADPVAGAASGQDVVGAQTQSDERDGAVDDATRLERALRARIGSVGRSLGAGAASVTEAHAVDQARDQAQSRLEAERRLVRRRGTVLRNNETGGWRFVPVTQDGGSPDPPMEILASSVVPYLERTVRAADGPMPLLLTGRVVRYRDEHWLRVATFEAPRIGRGGVGH